MYPADPEATVVELTSLPHCDTGVPSPQILANEQTLLLAYLIQMPHEMPTTAPDSYAVVRFDVHTHMFGSPNDETLNGHPLYNKGLGFYGAYQVLNSPWIKQLENMNSVHPRHTPELFHDLLHYIFTFHDSTLECVARSFEVRAVDSIEAVADEFRKEFYPKS